MDKRDFLIENGMLVQYTGTDKCAVIPETVVKLHPNAFLGCKDLREVVLPKTITEDSCFCDLRFGDAFQSITVHPENLAFTSLDGVLYNKELTRLVFCPRSRKGHFAVPDTVREVGEYAFAGCGFQTVKLPQGLKSIGDGGFEGCTALERMEVPDSVEYIGYVAFRDCWVLKYIYLPENAYIEEEECTFLGSFSKMEIDGRGGYFYGIDYGSSW